MAKSMHPEERPRDACGSGPDPPYYSNIIYSKSSVETKYHVVAMGMTKLLWLNILLKE